MKTGTALALGAVAIVLLLATAAPAAGQGLSPNSNNNGWVKAPTCAKGVSYPQGCCCGRPRNIIRTKYKTRTAIKTLKRTKTVTRTVTSTSFVRAVALMARDVEAAMPELAERALPEAPEAEVSEAEVVQADPKIVERSVPEEPAAAEQSPAEASVHALFARNLCQACPNGVNPRIGANNNGGNGRPCCIRSTTKFTTRTKTTTRLITKTVKTATKTVTTTVTSVAPVRIPVLAFTDVDGNLQYNNPPDTLLPNTVVVLQQGGARRLEARQIDLGSCTTGADGTCTILLPAPLAPNTVYSIRIPGQPGVTVFTTDANGFPPSPVSGFFQVASNAQLTGRLGRRELIGRRDADGKFRRALKARATPAPAAF